MKGAIDPKTAVYVLIIIFISLISFVIANTTMGFMKPTFDQINRSVFTVVDDKLGYDQKSTMLINFFYIALAIIILIPFIWFALRVIKKEPEPEYYYGGYYVRI